MTNEVSVPSASLRPVEKKNGNGKPVVSGQATSTNGGHAVSVANSTSFGAGRDAATARRIHIHIARTKDSETDKKRVRDLFHLLTRAPGVDRFYFYIPNEHGLAQIDFPNNTTNYAQVEEALHALAGAWAIVRVE